MQLKIVVLSGGSKKWCFDRLESDMMVFCEWLMEGVNNESQNGADALVRSGKRGEKGGYGKCMKNLRLRPVVLSAVTYEDIKKRAESVPQKEIRKSAIARMLREADKQGGTLAETDLSPITHPLVLQHDYSREYH